MNVAAVEMGDRPTVFTKARRFAPEGVKVLAELLGHFDFADGAVIVLDWDNSTGRQPDDAHYPVVFITVVKSVGPEQFARVEVRLDVEDTFGRDEIMAEDFVVIVQSLEKKMNEFLAKAQEV